VHHSVCELRQRSRCQAYISNCVQLPILTGTSAHTAVHWAALLLVDVLVGKHVSYHVTDVCLMLLHKRSNIRSNCDVLPHCFTPF
jgi:hypothetical protein